MRLLIVSTVFAPDHAGGASIYTDFASAMAERGHEVTVRCTYPHFPEWRDKSGGNGVRIGREELDGCRVERFGAVIASPSRLSRRLLFEGSLLASLSRSLPAGAFDAVLVFATNPGSTAFGALVGRLRRYPLWINVQDLASDAAGATGVAGGGLGTVLGWVDRRLLGQADVLSGLSPGMVERLQALCPRADVRYLPNWLHRSLADEARQAVAEVPRPRLGDGPVELLYAGNVGGKQDLVGLCAALAASSVDFRLRIHAAGSGVDRLRAWVTETGDARITLAPLLPEAEFARALRRCHLFVISETAGSGHSYFPSKLLPVLATATPVFGVADPDGSLGIELRTHDLGPFAGWDELPKAVAQLSGLTDADLDRWAANASARGGAFDRDALVDELATGLERLAGVADSTR